MINLTPHAIVIRTQAGDRTIPPSGTVARVACDYQPAGEVSGVPVFRAVYGAPTGLPAAGEPCIVSGLVLAAVPGRAGVYAPDTGPTCIRDDAGRIVAVTRLIAA